MKADEFTLLGRLRAFRPGAALMLIMLVQTVAAATTASAQTTVFVPGNAGGAFGSPVGPVVPLVPGITVNGPATITVTYVGGTVDTGYCLAVCLGPVGPNGGRVSTLGAEYPLQEAVGVSGGTIDNIGALMGVFVPKYRVNDARGFQAIDGTKDLTRIGIRPDLLRFVGEGRTFDVHEAGTLFLGINDWDVADNSGGFTVTVTATGQ